VYFVLLTCFLAVGLTGPGIPPRRRRLYVWMAATGGVVLMVSHLPACCREFSWLSSCAGDTHFWESVLGRFFGGVLIGTASLLILVLLTLHVHETYPRMTFVAWPLGFYAGFICGNHLWDTALSYIYSTPSDLAIPFARHASQLDVSVLSFFNRLPFLLLMLAATAVGTHMAAVVMDVRGRHLSRSPLGYRGFRGPCAYEFLLSAALLLLAVTGHVWLTHFVRVPAWYPLDKAMTWMEAYARLPVYVLGALYIFAVTGLGRRRGEHSANRYHMGQPSGCCFNVKSQMMSK